MTTVPRPSSSLVAFWALLGIGVLYVGDSLVRGDAHVFLLALAPVGLIVWAAWLFLYRPRVSFDRERVVIVNPGRIITAPWQRVSAVRQRFQILLDLDDGTTVTCWGSPFPEKPGRRRGEATVQIVAPLEAARAQVVGRASEAPTERRWDLVPLGIGALLIVLCIAELVAAA